MIYENDHDINGKPEKKKLTTDDFTIYKKNYVNILKGK